MHKNWKASLQSFSQPVPLQIESTDEGFALSLQHQYGITEGPAHLVLTNKDQQFVYEVNLHNSTFGLVSEADYRSPKTVNPDSSLEQHRMVHTIDEWRNLLFTQNTLSYFKEEVVDLLPTAASYRAQKQNPISAFYVQPGSPVSIPISAVYDARENVFNITAGPLKDKYNNTVANGTMVAFLYSDGLRESRMEAALLNGLATVIIPATRKNLWLRAAVNTTTSNTIQLNAE
ncbi:MAG TPA: hypothetical protein VFV46_06240 [Lacibacter sp.]|nr:hypothetical protein [Lacibacter sp.]